MTQWVMTNSKRLKLFLMLSALLSVVIMLRIGTIPVSGEWMVNYSRDAGLVLKDVNISGNIQTSRPSIYRVLDVDEGMPLVAMDLAAMRQRIEGLSWVKSVALRRQFPDQLYIQIQERTPVALWQHRGVVSLIDNTGHIMTQDNLADYADYLLLVGEFAHKYVAEISQILDSQPQLKSMIRSAVRVGDRRWDIHFKNGMRLRLPEMGNNQSAVTALARFQTLQEDYDLLSREIAVVDLRGEKLIVQLTKKGKRMMLKKNIYS